MDCKMRENCPHVKALIEKIKELEKVMDLGTKEIHKLNEENKSLKEEKKLLSDKIREKMFKKNQPIRENKKIGAPIGHTGKTRKKPQKIDEYINVYPKECPQCGSENISIYNKFDPHIVEDVEIRVKTTCYNHYYGYCKDCGKTIYPKTDEEISHSHIGSNARAIAGYLRYTGIPYRKVKKIFSNIFGLALTSPSLVAFDKKFAENGKLTYEQIKSGIRESDFLHIDETGWRVSGTNNWLWCFVNNDSALYHIDKTRSSGVVEEILGNEYSGVIISDFYSAYNRIKAKKQKCLSHLLRDMKDVLATNICEEDRTFCNNLVGKFKSAMELWRNRKGRLPTLEKDNIVKELVRLLHYTPKDKKLSTIYKRILRYNNELLTFLDNPDIEPTNNRAERQLRPNVILRKVTFGNKSQAGIKNHEVLMSIIETAILRGLEPFDVIRKLNFPAGLNLLSMLPP